MPQTQAGAEVLKKFMHEYGAKKGQRVFYGRVNSGSNKFAKAMGEMSVRKRAGKK
jgi:hypothetical protein